MERHDCSAPSAMWGVILKRAAKPSKFVDENTKTVVAALLMLGGLSLIVGMMVAPSQAGWLSEWRTLFAGAGMLAGAVIVILAAKWFFNLPVKEAVRTRKPAMPRRSERRRHGQRDQEKRRVERL